MVYNIVFLLKKNNDDMKNYKWTCRDVGKYIKIEKRYKTKDVIRKIVLASILKWYRS